MNAAEKMESGDIPFLGIDHVQLAMPPAGETAARGFYAGMLGMMEIPKPVELARHAGCW